MPATSVFQKLKVITWKNYIIGKRHWISIIAGIAISILMFALLVCIYVNARHLLFPSQNQDTPTYNPQRSSEEFFKKIDSDLKLYYAPQTKFTSSVIKKVQSKLKLDSKSIKGFSTEDELLVYYQESNGNANDPLNASTIPIMGIVFNGIGSEKTPKHLDYAIRPYVKDIVSWDTETLYTREAYQKDFGSMQYVKGGFIAIQLAVDTSFIEMNSATFNNKQNQFSLFLQEFPYPPYKDRSLDTFYEFLIAITCIMSFTFATSIVRRIVEEKSTGIKELMKMMGLKSWMLWFGWFLHQLIISIISISIIIFLLTTPCWGAEFPVLRYCSRSLLAAFLILFCASVITFCFAISSLFNKQIIAVVVVIVAILLTKFVPEKILDKYPSMSGWWDKIWFALFPNMAVTYGYQAILQYDIAETEVNWINLFQSASGGIEDITLGNVFVMFLIDMVVYMLIALYFENINPGPYGLSKPFHFPITCLLNCVKKTSNQMECCDDVGSEDYYKIEPVTNNLKAGIQIRKLYKIFGTYFAVNGLSIDIYEGQITALLGHNGAGKTTTMSIITGMIAASSGNVVVNGANIKHEMNKIHGIMGLCPQHNLQFTDLTVTEHLIFFGMLKGLTLRRARNESKILLDRLNLKYKQKSLASTLSGGMRRRLSLGIALIGNSKVLILDEPTSGLDPEARRDIWDILLSLRGSRTIVISTHVMEEADVLGDRIAIMDHGKLICYGTSMFLKKEYGAGYNLTIILNSSQQVNSNQGDKVTGIVKSIIESAVPQPAIGSRLIYLLPFDKKRKFGTLLMELEKQKETLAISNIALSITTLEEVFLKVGQLTSKQDNPIIEIQPMRSQVNPSKKVIGMTLYMQQISALFTKRFLTIRIKLWTFLFLALLTLALTYLVLLSSDNTSTDSDFEFKMDLSKYGETLVYYGPDSTNRDINKVKKCYVEQVEAQGSRANSSESVSNVLIDRGIENLAYYSKQLVVAAEFNTSSEGKINAMYSSDALHGAPISLNLITNAIVKALYGKAYGISTSNNPLPRVDATVIEMAGMAILTALAWFALFPLGLLLCTVSFVVFPQMEIANKAKQLQLMCGVRSCCYWLTFYIFDLFLYWIFVIAIIILILLYESWGSTPFSGKNEICALSIIMLVYGFCAIPYSYLFAYDSSPSRAFNRCIMFAFFPSAIIPLVIILLELIDSKFYNLIYLCLWLPQFGLAYTILKFSYYVCLNYSFLHLSDESRKSVCAFNPNACCDSLTRDECREYLSYFKGDSGNISVYLEIMMASTLLYFALLFLIESKLIFNMVECCTSSISEIGSDTEILELRLEDIVLIVKNLTKIYRTQSVVSEISFVVKRGDCFGLLGVNGAGKTTTFRMLTGDEIPTEGDAEIKDFAGNSFKLSNNARKYLKNIGYCPQFDAIIEILTARQMLKLFAKLRGVPKRTAADEIDEWISILGLQEYADKPCGKYSGGNKRKLGMAMAFIGNPPLVMLDEPTSGVDPVSRRKLWNVITLVQKQDVKTSIILCSHSMDECEALCDKLTIMKAGRLECSGTIPKLKQKYGTGFTIKIKLKDVGKSESSIYETTSAATQQSELSDVTITTDIFNLRQYTTYIHTYEPKEIRQLMRDFEQKYFGICELCDKHSGLLHYRITSHKIKLGQLFNEMEDLSSRHSIIEDFQISDTALEEVFLSIARSKNKMSL